MLKAGTYCSVEMPWDIYLQVNDSRDYSGTDSTHGIGTNFAS